MSKKHNVISDLEKFDVYFYNGRPHQIIKHDYKYLRKVFPVTNLASFIKRNLTFFIGKKLSRTDINDLKQIQEFSPIFDACIDTFDYIVIGNESLYQRLTYITKDQRHLCKLLKFHDKKACEKTYLKMKSAFLELLKIESPYFEIDIPKIKRQGSLNIILTSTFQKNLKKISPNSLWRPSTIKSLKEYFSCVTASPSIPQHGDFKIHNLGLTNENKLFIYDLETVGTRSRNYDLCFFLNELKNRSKRNWLFAPAYCLYRLIFNPKKF